MQLAKLNAVSKHPNGVWRSTSVPGRYRNIMCATMPCMHTNKYQQRSMLHSQCGEQTPGSQCFQGCWPLMATITLVPLALSAMPGIAVHSRQTVNQSCLTSSKGGETLISFSWSAGMLHTANRSGQEARSEPTKDDWQMCQDVHAWQCNKLTCEICSILHTTISLQVTLTKHASLATAPGVRLACCDMTQGGC